MGGNGTGHGNHRFMCRIIDDNESGVGEIFTTVWDFCIIVRMMIGMDVVVVAAWALFIATYAPNCFNVPDGANITHAPNYFNIPHNTIITSPIPGRR